MFKPFFFKPQPTVASKQQNDTSLSKAEIDQLDEQGKQFQATLNQLTSFLNP